MHVESLDDTLSLKSVKNFGPVMRLILTFIIILMYCVESENVVMSGGLCGNNPLKIWQKYRHKY